VRVWTWAEEEAQWISLSKGDIVNNNLSLRTGSGIGSYKDQFGHDISISKASEGNVRVAVGVPMKNLDKGRSKSGGMVLVFEYKTKGQWKLVGKAIQGKVKGEELGHSVQLLRGQILVAGAPGANDRKGSVRIYKYTASEHEWTESSGPIDGTEEGGELGYSVAAALPSRESLMLSAGATATNKDAGYVASFQQVNDYIAFPPVG